jgi:hypothetical protein
MNSKKNDVLLEFISFFLVKKLTPEKNVFFMSYGQVNFHLCL